MDERIDLLPAELLCECDFGSIWAAHCTGAPLLVMWSAGSDSGTVCKVVLIVADIVVLISQAAAAILLLFAAALLTEEDLLNARERWMCCLLRKNHRTPYTKANAHETRAFGRMLIFSIALHLHPACQQQPPLHHCKAYPKNFLLFSFRTHAHSNATGRNAHTGALRTHQDTAHSTLGKGA